jgi:hypothetical protein
MPKKYRTMMARKPLVYATRHLMAGDIFDVEERLVLRLLASKKAVLARKPVEVPPPPPKVAEKIAAAVAPDDRAALRAEYVTVAGKNPWPGWDAAELRERIAAAKESL